MDVLDWFLGFLLWQIAILPYLSLLSFGLAAILLPFALILLTSEDAHTAD